MIILTSLVDVYSTSDVGFQSKVLTSFLTTSLVKLILSLGRAGSAPVSPHSNCNAHQRIALYIILYLSGTFAFLSSFVKRFVYDTDGIHILYPSPDLFNVPHYFKDPLTGVTFPCKTREKRYCWPLVNDLGELKYDDKGGGRIRVMVFKRGIQVHVNRKIWVKRVWKSWFKSVSTAFPASYLTLLFFG